MSIISTAVTELLGIKHPVLLAGMDRAAGPELAAAVTNAGGLGCIGGFGFSPKQIRSLIHEIKAGLNDKNAPFGVDLLIPQVGGSARKTNYDYTKGQLPEIIDVIIEEKTTLFISAVGVPPKWVIDKLHNAGILVMNMIGHPKHVAKAIDAGVDLLCAQAGEGGGHTGEIPASILIPACVDAAKGRVSAFTNKPVYVVGAGAIYDGRGLAANLAWGAEAVWVGTRFVASVESGAPKMHKELLVSAGFEDMIRTVVLTGRPARLRRTPYYDDWELNRQEETKELISKGIVPRDKDLADHPEKIVDAQPYAMGLVAAVINDVLPAKVIVENMVLDAAKILKAGAGRLNPQAKL
ncbi:2-nitropropane dioxygenase [Cristinia sonorae]|uniref:2-nitropropane dioxygenase n=1 Tax=Cristinia sonorae TaxID=1940300 RepID=A0A8K0UTD5_9AGAR|nr:2-nitropropane dioxygenase [Cristinia sonorae]